MLEKDDSVAIAAAVQSNSLVENGQLIASAIQQQQQQQQPEQPFKAQQLKEINENVEDTRFEVPTEQPIQQGGIAVNGVAGAAASATKSGNDVIYQEVNFINSSTNEGFTIQNEEKDLETRLK